VKEINLERLKDLVLARLSVGQKKPPTLSDITKVLYPLVRRRLTLPEWKRLLERALASLRSANLVAAERLVITAAGTARLAAALGSNSAPPAKSWREFKAKYLPRLAFDGLPAARDGNVRPSAAVLAQRLAVVPKPKGKSKSTPAAEMASVVDAWLRASLGLSAQQKLSFDMLRGALLARELGLPPRPLAQVSRVAVASWAEAASARDDAVADALTLRWLFAEPPAAATQTPAASRPARAAPLERIAAKALQAADGPGARQFGPNKVFIGSVWRALAHDPEIAGLGEAAFKRQLAEAHRRGLLKLGRADLVAAMDASEVSASEIVHQNATYHFILRGASA
jgi:hypothetical protein